jgi:hypothetical protein
MAECHGHCIDIFIWGLVWFGPVFSLDKIRIAGIFCPVHFYMHMDLATTKAKE